MDTDPTGPTELAARVDGIIVALIRLSTTLAPDDISLALSEHAKRAGFLDGAVLLVDHEQRRLRHRPDE